MNLRCVLAADARARVLARAHAGRDRAPVAGRMTFLATYCWPSSSRSACWSPCTSSATSGSRAAWASRCCASRSASASRCGRVAGARRHRVRDRGHPAGRLREAARRARGPGASPTLRARLQSPAALAAHPGAAGRPGVQHPVRDAAAGGAVLAKGVPEVRRWSATSSPTRPRRAPGCAAATRSVGIDGEAVTRQRDAAVLGLLESDERRGPHRARACAARPARSAPRSPRACRPTRRALDRAGRRCCRAWASASGSRRCRRCSARCCRWQPGRSGPACARRRVVAINGEPVADFSDTGARSRSPAGRRPCSVTLGATARGSRVPVARRGAARGRAASAASASQPAAPGRCRRRCARCERYGPLTALGRGHRQDLGHDGAAGAHVLERCATGEVSLKNLSGPLTIAEYAGDSAAAGHAAFVGFLVHREPEPLGS